MSMKNSSETIGDRTRDLPACSAVPQLTALRRAPILVTVLSKFRDILVCFLSGPRQETGRKSNRAVNFHKGSIRFPAYIILLNLPRKFNLRENWTKKTDNLHVELRKFMITYVNSITMIVFVTKVTNIVAVASRVSTGILITMFRLATKFTNVPIVTLNNRDCQIYRCSVVVVVRRKNQKFFALSIFSFLLELLKDFKSCY